MVRASIASIFQAESRRVYEVARLRVAREWYEAFWDDRFDGLSEGSIEYAQALQVADRVVAEYQRMAEEYALHETLFYRPRKVAP